MGSKSKRATTANEPQDNVTPYSKRSKRSQNEATSSISTTGRESGSPKEEEPEGMDIEVSMGTRIDRSQAGQLDIEEEDEEDGSEVDMQENDRESSGDDTDVEDDEDQELKANAAILSKKEAHTSDRVQKALTNPEIEAAFHSQYMTQITQAFGDELNTIREGVFALGVSVKSIWLMVLGRLIFGIGGECLEVAQAKITTDWFKARWLGFALGLNLSSARIANALNDNISPAIATNSGGVVGASWTGLAVCVLSLICGLILSHLDRAESRRSAGVRLDARKKNHIPSRKDNIVGQQAINASSDSTMTMSSVALEEEDEAEKENEMAEDDRKKWYMKNPVRAGAVMSIPDLVSFIGSPICGYIVDRFGNRARYIPLSAVLLIWAHAQLGFTMVTPVAGMLVLGLAYSLFASVLWPCIPFLVKDHQLGTAYGLVTIALNISLTFFPMIVASILHVTGGSYMYVEGLFICLAVIGLVLSIILNVLDRCQEGYLQPTEVFLFSEPQDSNVEYERVVYDQRELHSPQDHYNPREPGFEYRRKRRYSQDMFTEEDPDIEDVQDMVTTKPVGEGIIVMIPHRRRHSMAGFTGQMERARLSYYAHRARATPFLNDIPETVLLALVSSNDAVQANTPLTISKSPVDVIQTKNLPTVNPSLSFIGSIERVTSKSDLHKGESTELPVYTSTTTTTTKVTCKHGPLECAGNTQQLCFKKYFPNHKIWVPFVVTMNSWEPRRIGEPKYAREVAKKIVDSSNYDNSEQLLDSVYNCAKSQEGFDLLVESVQNTIDHGVSTSCTVFIDGKKRCVVDGGVWRECPEGSSVKDFVRSITEAASHLTISLMNSRLFRWKPE
ncbi:hypothetical protein BGX27_003531 [Mortierella sp. AM989]|nr:hypothetical protein BGX27_003531 [Mortierella sp. AM989]